MRIVSDFYVIMGKDREAAICQAVQCYMDAYKELTGKPRPEAPAVREVRFLEADDPRYWSKSMCFPARHTIQLDAPRILY